MKFSAAAWLSALAAAAWAQTASPTAPLPTRLQFCQMELQGFEGDERKSLLRACLLRRAGGERLVTQACRREVNEERGPAADRARRQRDCESRALAVPSSELPQRAVASGATGSAAGASAAVDQEPGTAPVPADVPPPAGVEAAPSRTGVAAPETDRGVAPVELPDKP